MTVTDEMLKPCPFCGAKLVQRRPPHGGWWHGIDDYKCVAASIVVDDLNFEQWNTRHSASPTGNGVERVRERVRDYIYDCTTDDCGHGWTLSAHQTDDLITMILQAIRGTDEGLRSALEQIDGVFQAGGSVITAMTEIGKITREALSKHQENNDATS